jgi:hypothetical protein
MAEKLKVTTTVTNEATIWAFKGTLDETVRLPEPEEGTELIRCDLENLSYVSSNGLLEWRNWITRLSQIPRLYIVLEKCPVTFVKFLGKFKGMLTPRVQVDSFFVPYFSEKTREETDTLFRRGKEYDNAGQINPPQVVDSTGEPMQMDVFQNSYFSFLRNQ